MKTEAVGHGISYPATLPNNRQQAAEKHALNKSILDASINVSTGAVNYSAQLLTSAVEHLNKALAPEFGNNAIQKASTSGQDFSPEAVANRIVSMSTAFFGKYQENHPEKDQATALKDFVELIGGGIDKGFAEAREILDSLKVLTGDVASSIDKTYELVQSGLQSFVANYPRAA